MVRMRFPELSIARLVHGAVLVFLQPAVPVAVLVGLRGLLFGPEGTLLEPTPSALAAVLAVAAGAVALFGGVGLLVVGRVSLQELGLRREGAGRLLGLGLAGAAACSLAVIVAVAASGQDVGALVATLGGYSASQRLSFVILGVAIALWEEGVFRGYLQPALIARLGVPAGVAATAVVYALWHPPHFHAVGMSARLAQGLVLGALRGRDRSLTPPVLAHALYWSAFGLT
jgi:membrane protease YdiL (CAAX protease family)